MPQGKLMTVGIQTPTGAARPGDLSFTGIPDNGGHVGHIYAEGDWRRFGVISREKNRNFYTVDKVAIGASDGTTFTWRDTLEVNGVTKLDHLFVAGIVTFASNQTFSGVTYDSIVVKQVANFYAYNNSGGFSDEGIKWENYGHYTIVDEEEQQDSIIWKLLVLMFPLSHLLGLISLVRLLLVTLVLTPLRVTSPVVISQ